MVGEDGLGQGGACGSHGGRGAAGSDAGGSREPAILTNLRGVHKSAQEKREGLRRIELDKPGMKRNPEVLTNIGDGE